MIMSESSGAPSAPTGESAAPVESNTGAQESQGQSSESGQPSAEDIQAAAENGEISQAEASKLIRKYKLKVRGQEVEREVDLGNDDFIRDQLQLAEMSKISMQQSAELKKAYLKEMERLKSDPFSVLQELGLDPEELSAGFIHKKIEEMKKSPEQLATEKMQREMEELRTKLKEKEEAEKQQEMSKLNEQAVQSLNQEIDKAISGHKKLPNSPMVRKKIADSMLWAMQNGFEDVTADDVVPLVEKELRSELGSLFEGLEDEAFEDWIGKERLAKARKKKAIPAVTKQVPGLSNVKPTTAAVKAKEEPAQPQKIKAKDFFRNR
jgi:hypothetical protein